MPRPSRGRIAAPIALALLVGSALIVACGDSGLQDVEGPHMLYFYAEW